MNLEKKINKQAVGKKRKRMIILTYISTSTT